MPWIFLVNRALPLAKQSGDAFLIGNVEKAIATVFMNANKRHEAADYLNKAIDHIERSDVNNPVRVEALVETYVYAAENHVDNHQLDSVRPHLYEGQPHPGAESQLEPVPDLLLCRRHLVRPHKRYGDAVNSFDKAIELGKNDPRAAFSINRLKRRQIQITYQ